MPLHVSDVTRPSSAGSAQLLFGAIACVRCVDYMQVVVELVDVALHLHTVYTVCVDGVHVSGWVCGRVSGWIVRQIDKFRRCYCK
jgi:hypothetical protein